MTMATWPHISAKNKTDVLQEGLPTGSEGGLYIAGCTKHRWQSEPPSPGKNVMCTRWDTLLLGNAPTGAWLVARVCYFQITEILLIIGTYNSCFTNSGSYFMLQVLCLHTLGIFPIVSRGNPFEGKCRKMLCVALQVIG